MYFFLNNLAGSELFITFASESTPIIGRTRLTCGGIPIYRQGVYLTLVHGHLKLRNFLPSPEQRNDRCPWDCYIRMFFAVNQFPQKGMAVGCRCAFIIFGVGVYVAYLDWVGNAKATSDGMSNRIQTPALFLCISIHNSHIFIVVNRGAVDTALHITINNNKKL